MTNKETIERHLMRKINRMLKQCGNTKQEVMFYLCGYNDGNRIDVESFDYLKSYIENFKRSEIGASFV